MQLTEKARVNGNIWALSFQIIQRIVKFKPCRHEESGNYGGTSTLSIHTVHKYFFVSRPRFLQNLRQKCQTLVEDANDALIGRVQNRRKGKKLKLGGIESSQFTLHLTP
jgi:hypothetical protein